MQTITFQCCSCKRENLQEISKIPEMTCGRHIRDNLYALHATWIKQDKQGKLIKGRTYCTHCYAPKDFSGPLT